MVLFPFSYRGISRLSFLQSDIQFKVYSFLNAHSWMIWKKKSRKQKNLKKMLWLQRDKITVIHSQNILLDDNTICSSLFRS